jgi:cleavage and polyadenylation specificity factor subunit 1
LSTQYLIPNICIVHSKVNEDSEETPERSLIICVGTSAIDQDGEDLASKGRILLFEVKKSKKRALNKNTKDPPLQLMLTSEKHMALGPVTSLSSLKSEDVYRIVVGAGAEVTVEQWGSGKLTPGKVLTQVGEYSITENRRLCVVTFILE